MSNALLDSPSVPEELKRKLEEHYANPNTIKLVQEKRDELITELKDLGFRVSGDSIYNSQDVLMKANLRSFNTIMTDLIFFQNPDAVQDLKNIIKEQLKTEKEKLEQK